MVTIAPIFPGTRCSKSISSLPIAGGGSGEAIITFSPTW
jgi:hypothetical protein